MSQLINGKIPAHTECEHKAKQNPMCQNCHHKGKNHAVPFSCALARAYEIIEQNQNESSVQQSGM